VADNDAMRYHGHVTPGVYLETTIISYLAAHPSRDLVTAARQRVTADWWASERERFSLYVSELVLREAADGDADAVSRRCSVPRTS
jgi:hypothetical protein